MEELYIRRIIKGNIALYSYFINRYKDMAYTIASRIVANHEDAEEVVQDSFLKAYNALGKFRKDASFSTWLYKIVVNTALTRIKKNLSSSLLLAREEIIEDIGGNEEETFMQLQQHDQRKIIHVVLAEMEMEDRLLLTLYYLNENSIAEIAEIISIPAENIKMKLHRARKKMYLLLDKKLKTEMQYLL